MHFRQNRSENTVVRMFLCTLGVNVRSFVLLIRWPQLLSLASWIKRGTSCTVFHVWWGTEWLWPYTSGDLRVFHSWTLNIGIIALKSKQSNWDPGTEFFIIRNFRVVWIVAENLSRKRIPVSLYPGVFFSWIGIKIPFRLCCVLCAIWGKDSLGVTSKRKKNLPSWRDNNISFWVRDCPLSSFPISKVFSMKPMHFQSNRRKHFIFS